MKQACRNVQKSALNRLSPQVSTHSGLILQRFLESQAEKADEPDHRKGNTPVGLHGKEKILDIAEQSVGGILPWYEQVYQRYVSQLQSCVTREMEVEGRLVVGLGSASPLETGLTLHHTYGIPYVPATALKGLASHYCGEVWGQEDERYRRGGEYHRFLFGTLEESGHIRFFDAWITPETLRGSLVRDVMTVHHPDYYQGDRPPTDFDDPNPIPFLSCKGHFLLALSSERTSYSDKWTSLTMELLNRALQQWGVGGKTNAGYGRMKAVVEKRERGEKR
ncbi:type III-B CRISPR module RAMP protein Cmr6 [Kyrpidia spormannii]|uniref:Type III-B CRISPR module RAMP protein Cmr6 n=1 Tax=Kyrpidia spormannii TaxID=2055160 RepID=A0A2K8N717_9BACL|nr:type III-B CRISPR module RAMP protein Cmr6 [Kyrpidia spormannii]ATY85128.1 type III-B CRISPR module RAMP protein Cmr6 [Kyrpidia spormannii]